MTDLVVRPGLPLSDRSDDTVVSHTATVRIDGKRRNMPIQWLRAIAALSVMLYHSGVYASQILHTDLFDIFGSPLAYMGVALFFAISGYLMSIAVRVQRPALFLTHRIVRIYPIYLLIAALLWLINQAVFRIQVYDFNWLLLMPQFRLKHPFVNVEWSLIFEVSFYSCLFLIGLVGASRHIGRIAFVWALLILAAAWIWPDPGITLQIPLYRLLFVMTSLPMAGGLMIQSLLRWKIPAWALLTGAVALWAAYPFCRYDYDLARLLFGVSSVLVVWAAVAVSDRPRLGDPKLAGRILARFGDYSYALYLVHVPIMHATYKAFSAGSPLVVWTGTIAAILLASVLVGELDLRIYKRLKGGLTTLPALPVKAIAFSFFAGFVAISSISGVLAYKHRSMQAKIENTAIRMLAAHSIRNDSDAVLAAEAIGLTPSSRITGSFDTEEWRPDTNGLGRMTLDLWAVDLDAPKQPVWIAMFRNNKLYDADTPNFVRQDVRKMLSIAVKSGYFDQKLEYCHPDEPMVAVILDADDRFAILPLSVPYRSCRSDKPEQ